MKDMKVVLDKWLSPGMVVKVFGPSSAGRDEDVIELRVAADVWERLKEPRALECADL